MNNSKYPVTVVLGTDMGFDATGVDVLIPCGAFKLGNQNLSTIMQEDSCGSTPTRPGDHVPDVYPYSVMTTVIQADNTKYYITPSSYDAYLASCNGCCTPLPVLATPANFTGTNGNTQSVINWNDVTDSTGYVLERSLSNSFTSPVTVYTGTVSGYTNTGLTNGTTYYYRVKATAPHFQDSQWAYIAVTPAP